MYDELWAVGLDDTRGCLRAEHVAEISPLGGGARELGQSSLHMHVAISPPSLLLWRQSRERRCTCSRGTERNELDRAASTLSGTRDTNTGTAHTSISLLRMGKPIYGSLLRSTDNSNSARHAFVRSVRQRRQYSSERTEHIAHLPGMPCTRLH